MSTSADIRALAREGLTVAEIARRLGIRYQHAYNVLKRDGASPSARMGSGATADGSSTDSPISKPVLRVVELLRAGFSFSGRWVLSATGDVSVDRRLPKEVGVYAFARDGTVLYVGVATMGLAKRLYFYAKPGVTQRTSLRLNGIIKSELQKMGSIDIYTAIPPDFEWNGLPVHGTAGLELGLIKKFALPWNMRSAG
jgi:hypothetical protein